MSNDIIARLGLDGRKFVEDTRATFSAFNRDAVETSAQAKTAFESNFAEIQATVRRAIKMQPTGSSQIDLGVADRKAAAAAAEVEAVALRDVATAAQQLALKTNDTSAATRLYIQAAQAAANEGREKAGVLAQEAVAYERLQVELNATRGSVTALERAQLRGYAASGQARQAAQSLGQQMTDFSVQVLSGQSAFTAFAQQAPQAGLALAGFEGKLGKVGAFLTGPWGIALTIGVSALGILGSKLLDTSDAADKAKKGVEDLARYVGNVGGYFDQATGKIKETNAALIQFAVLTARQGRKDAEKAQKDAAEKGNAALANSRFSQGTMLAGGGVVVAGKRSNDLRDLFASGKGIDKGLAQIAGSESPNAKLTKTILEQRAQFAKSAKDIAKSDAEIRSLLTGKLDPKLRTSTGTPDRTARLDQQAKLAAATSARERAEAQLALTRTDAKAALDAGTISEDQYRQRVTAGEQAVNRAEAAEKAAAAARRDGNRARRETITLANQQTEAEQRIANIAGRFDAAPALVDQMDAANRALDEEIAKYGKLKDAVSQSIVAKATAAKITIAAAPAKPFNDLVQSQERGLVIQRLALQGRDAEAGTLGNIFRLMDAIGAKDVADLQIRMAKAGVEGNVVDILARQSRQQEAMSRAIEDQRRQVGVYVGAVDDAQRTFETFVTSLRGGSAGSAFKNLRRDLVAGFNNLNTRLLSEKLFGGLDREIADLVQGKNGTQAAGDTLAHQVTGVGTSLEELIASIGRASTRIAAAPAGAAGPVSTAAASLTERPADDPENEVVVIAQRINPALERNTAALLNSADVYNLIGGKLTARLQDLGIRLPKALGDNLGSMMKNASLGALGGGAFASITGGKKSGLGSSIGGVVGGELAKGLAPAITNAVGGALGQTLGQAAGPIGAIAGGILGNVIGGLFQKTKQASSTITFSGGSLAASKATGTGTAEKAAASASANGVVGAINRIAEALGGEVTGAGSVSIGYRPGHKDGAYRVDTTGQGRLTGVLAFATEEEAIRAAIADALKDGVVGGISDASKRILAAGGDLEKAITKAALIEAVPKDLKALLDPLGAAVDELNRKFQKTVDALKEGGATAEQMAQAQQLYDLQLAQVKASTAAASASLKEFLRDLVNGSDSPLSLRDREAAALADLKPFLTQIDAGQAIDQSKYQEAAKLYLDIERELYGSTAKFFEAFDVVQASTTKAIATIDNAVPVTAGVASPFAKETAESAAATAAAAQTGNEIASDQTELLARIATAVEALGGDLGTTSGFIGSSRLFTAKVA